MTTKTLDAVDKDLREIIDAVERAANSGMAHRDDPKAVERILADCEEMLHVVMDASILES